MSIIKQMSASIRQRGFLNICGAAARRLVRKPQIRWFAVMRKSLASELPMYRSKIPIVIEQLPLDATRIASALADLPSIHTFDISNRVQGDHRCFVATHQGQMIYASWIAFKHCYSYALERRFELADNEAYAYSAYTLPRFRGNGVHPAVRCNTLRLLKKAGYEWMYSFIDPRNRAAMRMPEKLDYERVGVTGFAEAAGVRWYFHHDHGAFKALERRDYWRKM